VNTDAPWPTAEQAGARVLGIQTKLHRWATDEQAGRFCDLYNLVCDPALLLVGGAGSRATRAPARPG
jgi:RNA-directed DNA polymerase